MDWSKSLYDEDVYAREQARLGGVWTFLGLTRDLRGDNDWISADLGGRRVFVQRFGEALRGFENVCAHRSFPLRTGEKGSGPIICGFHHWRYDADGRAVGVPIAKDAFSCTAEDLDARLRPLEIETCGLLVFGRFADISTGESLQAFLAEGYPILAAICSGDDAVATHQFGREVEANWKLMVGITLDDYHTPAIHGRKRYQRREEFDYWRFGAHSAHCVGHDDTLAGMAADCAAGRHQPKLYKIFNIFPNIAVSLFEAGPYWYAMIQQFAPTAPSRTTWRAIYFRTPWRAKTEPLAARLNPKGTDRLVAFFIRREAGKIAEEDHLACETHQSVARQIAEPSRLAAQEERVGWFAQAWSRAVGSAAT